MKNRALHIFVVGWAAVVTGRAQVGGFGGPSILSRGGGGFGASRGQAIGITAYGSVQGIYNWGFSPIERGDGTLDVPKLNGGGFMLDGGLVGYYQKQRHATSFAVRGLYSKNSSGNRFDNYGVNLELAHSQQLSRKTQIFLSLTGGKTNYTGQFLFRFTEEPVAQPISPGYEIFDNHLTTATGAVGITHQLTNRWTFSAQGAVFGADRKEKGLADTRGMSATGSMQYNFTRRTSAGVSYSYSWFYFPGNFGETRSNAGQVFANHQFGRRWTLGVHGGVFAAYTERLVSVPLDPLIAFITGQVNGLQIHRNSTVGWTGGGSMEGRYRDSSISFLYNRSLQPGNGVYLTSVSDLATINYTFQSRQHWNFSTFATYSKLGAITQTIGAGSYKTAGGSYSRRLNSFINLIGSSGVFHTGVFSGRFARTRVYVSAGIQFSPHDLPILR